MMLPKEIHGGLRKFFKHSQENQDENKKIIREESFDTLLWPEPRPVCL
ncbi:hypothetical protein EMIT043CA1_30291 [Pseudomonas brassicacearum]